MQLYGVNFIPLLGSLYMFRVFYTPIMTSIFVGFFKSSRFFVSPYIYWTSGLYTSYHIGQTKQRFRNLIFSDPPWKVGEVSTGLSSNQSNWGQLFFRTQLSRFSPPFDLRKGRDPLSEIPFSFSNSGKTDKSRNWVVLTTRKLSNVDWSWIPFQFLHKDPKYLQMHSSYSCLMSTVILVWFTKGNRWTEIQFLSSVAKWLQRAC